MPKRRHCSPRPDRRDCALVAAAVAAAALPAATPVAAETLYARGTAAWQARNYPPAATDLVAWRATPRGRSADVDYKIGTSGCRIAGQRKVGGQYLAHALKRYPLTPASRTIIVDELTLCLSTGSMPPLASTATAATAMTATAGATAQGKMYYSVDASRPVAAYPARPLGEPDHAAFQARLVPLGQPAAVIAKLEALAPAGASVSVRGRFAFVSTAGHRPAQLDDIAARLETYLGFLQSRYGIALPDSYLTIYLVRSVPELREVARAVHRLDVSPATIGYTFQDDQSAVAVIPGTVIGTLMHELFHMVVRTNFGDIPQWLDEGMASLYEVALIAPGGVKGTPNWRGPVLNRLWSQRPSLADVVSAPWFISDTVDYGAPDATPERTPAAVAAQFATARYFALYLQDKGKLSQVYAALQAIRPGSDDPAAAERRAVEAVIGPLAAVQPEWERWFRALEPDTTPRPACLPESANRPANAPPGDMAMQQQQQQVLPPCPPPTAN